jgi:hypothetical protein
MKPPLFQFTIGQLLKQIAIWAVVFAAIRTHLWPLLLPIGFVLAGFAIDRSRGGPGIRGAIGAGVILIMGFGIITLAHDCYSRGMMADIPRRLFGILLILPIMGLAFGFLVGYLAVGVLLIVGGGTKTRHPARRAARLISRRTLEDLGLQHPQAGGGPP